LRIILLITKDFAVVSKTIFEWFIMIETQNLRKQGVVLLIIFVAVWNAVAV